MQIDKAYTFLKNQSNPFDLGYISDGTDVIVQRNINPDALSDGYLEKMMKSYETDTIIALTKKGTGVVKRDDQRIIISQQTLPPANKSMLPQAPAAGDHTAQLYGFMLQNKEERVQDLQDKIRLLEQSLRSSETDNKKLLEENMRIERENQLMQGKHELVLKNLEADHERALNDKTNTVGHQVMQGLGNPELVNGVTTMLVGLAGAVTQAIANSKPQPATYQLPAGDGIQPVGHVVKYIQHITRYMNGTSPEEAAEFYYCAAHLAGNAAHRKEYFETYAKPSVAA